MGTEDDAVRHELLMRMQRDVDARWAWVAADREDGGGSAVEAMEAVTAVDRENSAWLASVLEEYGWPTVSRVGEDGCRAAWLIAQHADHDVALQQRALALLEEAWRDGEAPPRHVAMLTDRVLVNSGLPQRFATQFTEIDGAYVPQPTEAGDVEARRAAMSLETVAEATRGMEEAYGPARSSRAVVRSVCPSCSAREEWTPPDPWVDPFTRTCAGCGADITFMPAASA